MTSLNQVTLIGNCGNEPELRYTTSQIPVTTFSLATSEKYDGKETVEWHKIVVWGKNAENVAKFVEKGKSLLVQGKIKTRSYDDKKTGQKKYVTEIIAYQVLFLGSKTQGKESEKAPQSGSYEPDFGDLPF